MQQSFICPVFSVFHPFHFLLLHLSMFYCLFLSHFLSFGLVVPHGLLFPSLSVSPYNLLIPLPTLSVPKTFLFNCLCFSFGLSGFLSLAFCFLLQSCFLSLQVRCLLFYIQYAIPLYPCAGHLPGHYKERCFLFPSSWIDANH